MIAKSDVVIMIVSASLLAAGIYRWQSNKPQYSARHTVASAPAKQNPSVNRQSATAGSLAAKPTTQPASVAADANRTAGVDTATGSNFGSAGQVDSLPPFDQDAGNAGANLTSSTTQTSASNSAGQPLYGSYEVQSGDTLSKIANDYGTTVDTLRTINDISGSLITVGQNVLYPLPAN